MDVRVCILLLAWVALPAPAQQVYKCVVGKEVSYQSEACASGKASKTWEAAPVPEPTNAELWRRHRIQQQLDRRYAADRSRVTSGAGTSISPQSSGACESAKRQRQAVYDAAGSHRSFATSRAMDDLVYEACK